MSRYRIVAARPKDATHHLNSEFKIYEWKASYDVSALLKAGNEVRTGSVEGTLMRHGDAVELALRIAHNGTKYKISGMPDS